MKEQFQIAAKLNGSTGVYDNETKEIAWFSSLTDTQKALTMLRNKGITFARYNSEPVSPEHIIIREK